MFLFFSAIFSRIGAFFGAIKNYVIAVILVLLLLLGIAFSLYYNHTQSKISTLEVDQSKLTSALQTESESFKTINDGYTNLLLQLKKLQDNQALVIQKTEELKAKIATYNYSGNGKSNPQKTEKEINKTYSDMLNQLGLDTAGKK